MNADPAFYAVLILRPVLNCLIIYLRGIEGREKGFYQEVHAFLFPIRKKTRKMLPVTGTNDIPTFAAVVADSPMAAD